jgi:hypothetical protein
MRGELGCLGPASFSRGSAAHSAQFQVGGVAVRVVGNRGADVALVPSLKPFQIATELSDINIHVERVARLHLGSRRELFDSGSVWRLFEDENGFRFDFSSTALFGDGPYKRLMVDGEFRRASLLLSDECFAAVEDSMPPLGYPLDELLIMHRLTQERAIELHGCGIAGPDRTGNLFVGHSGAGKSTTARLWRAREDVEVLSDDRIILRLDGKAPLLAKEARNGAPGEAPDTVEGKGILRLRDCSASRNGHSAQDDKRKGSGEIRMYGTPWHGEAGFASPASTRVSRILVLEHGQGNVLTRLSPSQAVAELFARSFVPFYRHEYLNSALEFLQDVADSIPCYRYAFEPDQRAVETILKLHE